MRDRKAYMREYMRARRKAAKAEAAMKEHLTGADPPMSFEEALKLLEADAEQKAKPASARQVGGDHYLNMAIQPWDAIKAWLTPEEWRGYVKGTAIAYLAREGRKEGTDDLAKAKHFLDKFLEG